MALLSTPSRTRNPCAPTFYSQRRAESVLHGVREHRSGHPPKRPTLSNTHNTAQSSNPPQKEKGVVAPPAAPGSSSTAVSSADCRRALLPRWSSDEKKGAPLPRTKLCTQEGYLAEDY